MKLKYISPEMLLQELDIDDILMTSPCGSDEEEDYEEEEEFLKRKKLHFFSQ